MKRINIKIEDVITTNEPYGNTYHIEGDMLNGYKTDENGNHVPYICHENIDRPIRKIDFENGKLYCPCGRVFIINDNLKITRWER